MGSTPPTHSNLITITARGKRLAAAGRSPQRRRAFCPRPPISTTRSRSAVKPARGEAARWPEACNAKLTPLPATASDSISMGSLQAGF